MNVEVEDGLAGIGVGVGDEAVAGVVDAELFGEALSSNEDAADESFIFRRELVDAGDGLLGNDQEMQWGIRRDVANGNDLVIFELDGSRDLAGDDLFEQGAHDVP
jgi:hypothetical protein